MKRWIILALAAAMLAASAAVPASAACVRVDAPAQSTQEDGTGGCSALAQRVAELVNVRRAESGLPALTLSAQLCAGAEVKAREMSRLGYFSHESPNWGTPFEMMRALGIAYSAAGENLATGSTAEAVMRSWMASPSHRANILSANYAYIGVGCVNGIWVQWFTS